jgi:hypothetical protein
VAEGGYYASQHPRDIAGVQNQLTSQLSQLNPPVVNNDIDILCDDTTPERENTTITVHYTHPLLFNYVVVAASVNLRAQTVVPQLGGC